jgi:hypothetical protein
MGGFAQEYEPALSDERQQPIEVRAITGETTRFLAQPIMQLWFD